MSRTKLHSLSGMPVHRTFLESIPAVNLPLIQERLANVPRRSLNTDERDSLKLELATVQQLAEKALQAAEKVETTSNEAIKGYNNLKDDLNDVNQAKIDALLEIEGLFKPYYNYSGFLNLHHHNKNV